MSVLCLLAVAGLSAAIGAAVARMRQSDKTDMPHDKVRTRTRHLSPHRAAIARLKRKEGR